MDYAQLLELVKQRRSVRKFKPDPVSEDCIEKIIEVARWAPSGFNLQPWEFVVIKEKKLKNKIAEIVTECRSRQMKMEAAREKWQGTAWKPPSTELTEFAAAPVFILLFGDIRTRAGLPMYLRYDQRLFESTFNSGLSNAFLSMHLAASTLGLASQWVSQVCDPVAHCLIKDLLGIPLSMEVYDMMAVGYSDVKPRPKLLRGKQQMIHRDYCGEKDFRSDTEVRDFIKRVRTWTVAAHRWKPG
jgi:nitroreductase